MKNREHLLNALSGGMAVCAFLFLLWFRIGFGQDTPGQTIFGDKGDGYFNLWVLEHVHLEAPQGWEDLSNARILYPESGAYWFSDNLLTLSPPYILLRRLGLTRISSIYYVHIFWWTATFFAGWWMFRETARSIKDKTGGVWLAPWLAMAVVWMPARVEGLKHFQNHAVVFLILQTACALLFVRRRSTLSLIGMAACQFALIASAPYYGVLGIMVLVAWSLTMCTDSHVDIRRLLFRKLPWVLPWVVACIPIALAYLRHETPAYNPEGLLPHAWQLSDLLPPSQGGRLEGYPGLWFTGLLLLAGFWLFRTYRGAFRNFSWRREGVLAGILVLTLLEIREIYGFTSWLRLGLELGALFLLLKTIRRKNQTASHIHLFLFLSGLFIIGTALGPGTFYGNQTLDPSVWGIFSTWIPGVKSMRGLIRIMPAAAFMFTGLIYAMALKEQEKNRRYLWNAGALFLLTLALIEPWSQQAPRTSVDPAELELTEPQTAFFNQVNGVMLEVPAAPFHRNTQTMLRWQSFKNIDLINGYSGRSSERLDDLISVENHYGRASIEQAKEAQKSGTDWIVLRRAWVYDEKEEDLSTRYPEVYLDDRFRVLDLRSSPRNE